MNCDPATLLRSAKCFCRLPRRQQRAVEISRLCQIVSGGGGGDTPIPVVECDADALAFIAAAGLTPGSIEANAICMLVRDLKAYPAAEPGANRYWAREIIVYPFVGGTAASHAVNLKTPGTYNLTYPVACIHSARGIAGNDTDMYANTGFTQPVAMRDSIRAMFYLDMFGPTTDRYFYGGGLAGRIASAQSVVKAQGCYVSDLTFGTDSTNKRLGALFVQRKEAASKQCAAANNNWTTFAHVSTGVSVRYIYLLAHGLAGPAPAGTPAAFSGARCSGFSLGFPLDVLGGNAEKNEYNEIWNRYNNVLSRAHP